PWVREMLPARMEQTRLACSSLLGCWHKMRAQVNESGRKTHCQRGACPMSEYACRVDDRLLCKTSLSASPARPAPTGGSVVHQKAQRPPEGGLCRSVEGQPQLTSSLPNRSARPGPCRCRPAN